MPGPDIDPRQARRPLGLAIDSLVARFDVVLGDPGAVVADCDRIRALLSLPFDPVEAAELRRLPPLLGRCGGPIAAAAFTLLEAAIADCNRPWSLLEGMLAARDAALVRRALGLGRRLAESGALVVDAAVLEFLADRLEADVEPWTDRAARHEIAAIVGQRALVGLITSATGKVRRLAARLLDLQDRPADPARARAVLGDEAYAFLAPHLDYTRATHLDLVDLAPLPGAPPPAVASLRRVERDWGASLLRQVVARLGWARLNRGLEAHERLALSVHGSLPLVVAPAEARLLERCGDTRAVAERLVFVAHGGLPAEPGAGPGPPDPIARFRAHNLAHAAVLADLLDVAPLGRDKVRRILDGMDRIVEDYTTLFAAHSGECAILPGIYAELRQRILAELEREPDAPQLSAELTRLVQTFEEPAALGAVRTLHGLKRYLHQTGLRLGFRLLETGRAPDRTVDLVLATPRRVLAAIPCIRYADLDPASAGASADRPPHPVGVIVDAFALQLVHGQESFPRVDVFCYGNEVHYYLTFLKHPAFLRIDWSPPQQGGMIDLEYYGVSQYELEGHPDLSLEAVQRFFQRLEFDVRVEGTRVHARYDKERARDLDDLGAKAATLFGLAPHLMDLDWAIGALGLEPPARRAVAECWAAGFARWGVLPLGALTTHDRRGVLAAVRAGPLGDEEVAWSGDGACPDRFGTRPPAGFFERLRTATCDLGLESLAADGATQADAAFGQVAIERRLLAPLRQATARGELQPAAEGFRRAPAACFAREDAAERFAAILAAGDDAVAEAIALGRVVAPLERTLDFFTTGSVAGRDVQAAHLPLCGASLGLHVLRDTAGIVRMALFARDDVLCRRRATDDAPWTSNASCDALDLVRLLRANNYPTGTLEASTEDLHREVEALRADFRRPEPPLRPGPLPGERIVAGVPAAPGRTVGRALLDSRGRAPEDAAGAVLVAAAVRPEDAPFLHHVAGVVSTGGGILSHAGLLAAELRKPSLVVAGSWQQAASGAPVLAYTTVEYRLEEQLVHGFRVRVRRDVHRRVHHLHEGDLVVLDADAGVLRILGQEPDALALDEALRQLEAAEGDARRATGEREILAARGRSLRARHSLEKSLVRLADPVLAGHAVQSLLATGPLADAGGDRDVRAHLLALVLENPHVGGAARQRLGQLVRELQHRARARIERAVERIPHAAFVYEVVLLRLEACRQHRALQDAITALAGCGVSDLAVREQDAARLDGLTRDRLTALQAELAAAVAARPAAPGAAGGEPQFRHRLAAAERAGSVLGAGGACRDMLAAARTRLAADDLAVERRLADRWVVGPRDGGIDLAPLAGWKAAHLAEVERLVGAAAVPPWFAVTDGAFRACMDGPIDTLVVSSLDVPPKTTSVREAIAAILARPDLGPTQKTARVRALWEAVRLPEALAAEVTAAYERLGARAPDGTGAAFVAVRSSAREEDTETAARAGEFDTFLFVRGVAAVHLHLKRTWAGLWTERALRGRSMRHAPSEPAGGGVVVQRMVPARAAGVLHTIGLASGELGEMVLDVGLGLGEGVVTGTVGVDHVTVAKEGDLVRGPLRFRYVTGDKREQVVFDRRTGSGTLRTQTLYHQRLRPALEYVELRELVGIAAQLEAAHGIPLDIEFALEDTRLWILQVRPVPVLDAALAETLQRYPLTSRPGPAAGEPRKDVAP